MRLEPLRPPTCFGAVRAKAGTLPVGVADLEREGEASSDNDMLIAAGQAMTWRSAFTCSSFTAIPLSSASALLFGPFNEEAMPAFEQWHDRFARGTAHRMAGELTIASVAARLVGEAAGDGTVGAEAAEDAELLGSAIEGLARLLDDLEVGRAAGQVSDRIVADTKRTHAALLGALTRQWVSVHEQEDFSVHTVYSVSRDLRRLELERARARVALPWPSRIEHGIGQELGLARWRETMESRGHQLWCRVEDEDTLVTELWLRTPRGARV